MKRVSRNVADRPWGSGRLTFLVVVFPRLGQSVTDMLIAMLGVCSQEELDAEELEEVEDEPEEALLSGEPHGTRAPGRIY